MMAALSHKGCPFFMNCKASTAWVMLKLLTDTFQQSWVWNHTAAWRPRVATPPESSFCPCADPSVSSVHPTAIHLRLLRGLLQNPEPGPCR